MENYKEEIKNYIIDNMGDYEGTQAEDLHSNLFNNDYYIIGRFQAEEWLKNGPGIFNAIGLIKDYENDNLGEVTTDLTEPEKIVNMLTYIIGEELLNDCDALNETIENSGELTSDVIERIKANLIAF